MGRGSGKWMGREIGAYPPLRQHQQHLKWGQHKKEVLKRKGIMTVLIANLVPSRSIWEEHLSVELSRSGWPEATSSVGGLSSLLLGVGRTGSLWATPFPRQTILNCLRGESEPRARSTQERTSSFSLLLAVDGMFEDSALASL